MLPPMAQSRKTDSKIVERFTLTLEIPVEVERVRRDEWHSVVDGKQRGVAETRYRAIQHALDLHIAAWREGMKTDQFLNPGEGAFSHPVGTMSHESPVNNAAKGEPSPLPADPLAKARVDR